VLRSMTLLPPPVTADRALAAGGSPGTRGASAAGAHRGAADTAGGWLGRWWRRLVLCGSEVLIVAGGLTASAGPAGAETPAAPPGSASAPLFLLIAFGAAILLVFVLGLLLGEQWHRRDVGRRDRELARARREIDDLRGRRDTRPRH
jgi:hypothetical protein